MSGGSYRFDGFVLDQQDRRLTRDGTPIELNPRYLDALALLVREHGRLVTKERFLDEVWRGVPVTDEALTQCVRTLRRRLGDSATRPRLIETVPKHGYRLIAGVEELGADPAPASAPAAVVRGPSLRTFVLRGGAGTLGGGVAGVFSGLLYGLVGASEPLQPGSGAISMVIVMILVGVVAGLLGGAGIAFGIAAGAFARSQRPGWTLIGGAAGGLVMGAVAKLLGLDAFSLLVGRSPGDITGAAEGALLGFAIAGGAWLGSRVGGGDRLAPTAAGAALAGGLAGMMVSLLGGRMMAGSLDLLTGRFPGSRLRLDRIGGWFGEPGFGPIAQAVTGAAEGLLFGGWVAGAMLLAGQAAREQHRRSPGIAGLS